MKRLLALIALLVAACSSAGTAAPQATERPAITEAPTEEPTPDLSGMGVITFGTEYDPDTLLIEEPHSRFGRKRDIIAWSATLSRSVGGNSLDIVVASKTKSGVERVIINETIDISNPDADTLANAIDLAGLLDNKAGTYVMRYIDDGEVLAEGEFTLLK